MIRLAENISQVDITVCVCTFNRSESLKRTLESLCNLSDAGLISWEFLIIDNNSQDETVEVIEDFKKRLPLRYVLELKQGLSFSRNRALVECRGSLLIFIDDDIEVEQSWLKSYLRAAQEFPEADYFGGKILPSWPKGQPKWVKDESMALLSGIFVYYNLGEETRHYSDSDLEPYGANFALRRRLFERIGLFRVDLGISGKILGYGEETDYLIRAKSCGAVGVYVGKALCYHNVNPQKLTLRFTYKFGLQKGVAIARMGKGRPSGNDFINMLLYLLKGIYQLFQGREDRCRQCLVNIGIIAGIRKERTKR